MFRSPFPACAAFLLLAASGVLAGDWSAFSVIEKEPDGKSFRETVFLVNDSARTVTLSFPNFQFPGHGQTPAESIGPMGDGIVAPGEALRFVHLVPVDRKDGFAPSIGIQDISENIPIKRLTVKRSFGAK